MRISYFLGAAAIGFALLAAVGIQALVALFSSIPLTRRHSIEYPAFDTAKAYRRIGVITATVAVLVGVITALVLRFAPQSVVMGYLVGMILAFLCCLPRMSPNNEQNRKSYEGAYADCYPPEGGGNPAEFPTESVPAPEPTKPAHAPQPPKKGGESDVAGGTATSH